MYQYLSVPRVPYMMVKIIKLLFLICVLSVHFKIPKIKMDKELDNRHLEVTEDFIFGVVQHLNH